MMAGYSRERSSFNSSARRSREISSSMTADWVSVIISSLKRRRADHIARCASCLCKKREQSETAAERAELAEAQRLIQRRDRGDRKGQLFALRALRALRLIRPRSANSTVPRVLYASQRCRDRIGER